MPMTNRQLQAHYRYANEKYFDGELPDVPVRWGKLKGTVLARSVFGGKKWIPIHITISDKLRRTFLEKQTHITLYHEMAHIKLRKIKCDTPRFRQEMRCLAVLGALDDLL